MMLAVNVSVKMKRLRLCDCIRTFAKRSCASDILGQCLLGLRLKVRSKWTAVSSVYMHYIRQSTEAATGTAKVDVLQHTTTCRQARCFAWRWTDEKGATAVLYGSTRDWTMVTTVGGFSSTLSV